MALPTTNLTLHCDASDTDNIYTNSNGTGTPSDAGKVDRWDDEGDGIADVTMTAVIGGGNKWRTTTPLMLLPCIDFDTSDYYKLRDQADATNKTLNDVLTASAWTLAVAFYPETIADTDANAEDNDKIFADNGGYWGMAVGDATGTKELRCYNYSGGYNRIKVTIGTGGSWVAIYKFGGGNLKLRGIDGAGSITDATPVASGNTGSLGGVFHVGAGYGSGYNGRIGEFAVYNAELSGTDFDDLTTYFVEKWLVPPTPASTGFAFAGFTVFG